MTEVSVSPLRSTVRAFKLVAWSFFGIRKGSEFQKDVAEVTPKQVVLVGLVSGLLFVMTLVLVVNLIV
jgi:hypothetical protein